MDELSAELNVITLNCWGRKFTNSYREERMTSIGRYLATSEPVPHIVALQECFDYQDYLSIRRETRFALPFGKFYYSGSFGSGLVILSRWPIEESSMIPYSFCGQPTEPFRGGWYAGQGVACARIRYSEDEEDIVEVFNTDTLTSYGGSYDINSSTIHRISQAWEVAKLARGAIERGHLAIVFTSFNATPFSLPYRLLTSLAPLRDAWRVTYPDSSLGSTTDYLERVRGRPTPTAATNVAENGVTSGSAYNTWSWPRSDQRALRSGKRPMLVLPETPDKDGKRIDYIFFSRGGDLHAAPTDLNEILSANNTFSDAQSTALPAAPPGWVVKDVRVGLVARHPELGVSLSNRFSVEATLVLHTPTPLLRQRRRRRRRSRSKSKSRSRSRSRSASSSRGPSPTLGGNEAMITTRTSSAKKSGSGGTVTRSHSQRGTPTPNTIINSASASGILTSPKEKQPSRERDRARDGEREKEKEKDKEKERGRPSTPRSFTSTEAGINTLGARAAAMEQGTYLQSPTASSYRRGSRDRTAWDQQLTSLDSAPIPRLPSSAYDELAELMSHHAWKISLRRKLGMAHFAFWCLVLVGSYVGIWFLPYNTNTNTTTHNNNNNNNKGGAGGAFALLVASTLGFALGVTNLIYALFVHGSDLNKLAELRWELRNAGAVAAGMAPDSLAHQGIQELEEKEQREREKYWW